eukprot:31480-Pelagococcus_subviridis.AAC.7
MARDLPQRRAFPRRGANHSREQIAHARGAAPARHRVHAPLSHAPQRRGEVARATRVLEGVASGEHEVEHHAHRPHVHGLGVVGRVAAGAAAGAGEHLGRHVVGRADPYRLRAVEVLGQPEVDDLQRVRAALDHAVLGLDVAVAEAVVVNVRDAAAQLAEQASSFALAQAAAARVEVVEDVDAVDEFPDEDQDRRGVGSGRTRRKERVSDAARTREGGTSSRERGRGRGERRRERANVEPRLALLDDVQEADDVRLARPRRPRAELRRVLDLALHRRERDRDRPVRRHVHHLRREGGRRARVGGRLFFLFRASRATRGARRGRGGERKTSGRARAP